MTASNTTDRPDDRRRAAVPRLVLFDLESMTHEWSGVVEPEDLTSRSVVVSSMLEARRESDTVLVACEPAFSWAMTELFPGAAMYLGTGAIDPIRPVVEEFRTRLIAGGHGEVVVASCDPALLEDAAAWTGGRTLCSTRNDCRDLLLALSGDLVIEPGFVIGRQPA